MTLIEWQQLGTKASVIGSTGYDLLGNLRLQKWLRRNLIRFQYEPKRFTLKDGTYTPDFFLIDHNLYIEIKGQLSYQNKLGATVNAWGRALDRARELADVYQVAICVMNGSHLKALGVL